MHNTIIVRDLGLKDCQVISDLMYYFNIFRNIDTIDEIWCVQHYPIFTCGKLSKITDLIRPGKIKIMHSDRGGQITYHGPGQQIIYLLIDLKRKKLKILDLIKLIKNTVIDTLQHFFIKSYYIDKYPGIYVQGKKICSLGLKINKGCSYHGFALNINMDLSPFLYIHPCGQKHISMTQMSDFKSDIKLQSVKLILIKKILNFLKINKIYYK